MRKLFGFAILFFWAATCQADNFLNFIHISSKEGLSQNTINDIFQDKKGFIWFATNDGLNRYDGNEFRVFRVNNDGSNCISSNFITSLAEDNKNRLWIGTKQNGISIYYPESDSFVSLTYPSALSSNNIVKLFFLSPNHIFIAYENGKIDRINTENFLKTTIVSETFDKKLQRKHTEIVDFYRDDFGQVWIGSKNRGLLLLNRNLNRVNRIPLKVIHFGSKNRQDKKEAGVSSIIKIDKNRLAIATTEAGVLFFDIGNHTFRQISLIPKSNQKKGKSGDSEKFHNESNFHKQHPAFAADITSSLVLLNDTVLWVGTFDYGIIELNLKTGNKRYINTGKNNNNLKYNSIRVLFKDRENNIFIGSNGMGIFKYFPRNIFFRTIRNESQIGPNLTFRSVRSICKTGDSLWVGGYWGMNLIDMKTNNVIPFAGNIIPYSLCTLPGDQGFIWGTVENRDEIFRINISNLQINHFLPEKDFYNYTESRYKLIPQNDSLCWIGSALGRLVLYNYKTKEKVRTFSGETDTLFSTSNISTLFLRPNGELWVGYADDGILVLNSKTFEVLKRIKKSNKMRSASAARVLCITEDSKGNIWVGTGNGLYRYNDTTREFTGYFKENGLPNNTIYGIIEDNNGFLWISTNKGLSRFKPSSGTFVNYDETDGIQGLEFNTSAYFKNKKGDFIAFGGIDGLTWFNPDRYQTDTTMTNVVFTDIVVNDKPYHIVPAIGYRTSIDIPSGTYNVKIRFAGLNFINPAKIKYRYRLNGGPWIETGNNNRLLLGFNGYGPQKLEVNATNTDGVWSNHIASLTLNFIPPLYTKWWFILLLLAVLFFAGLIVFYIRIRILRNRQRQLELKIKKATAELSKKHMELQLEMQEKEKVEKQLRESNATKDKLFSIVAHDLISPFNSLLGFSEMLHENADFLEKEEVKEYSEAIYSASGRLFNFVQNLLHWSRSQQNKIKPDLQKTNLREITENVTNLLRPTAENKKIHLKNGIPSNIFVLSDKNLLNTIIRNLVTNAIKFTPPGKSIWLGAETKDHMVLLTVKDEGVGMDETTLKNLFDPAKKNKTRGTANEEGTGLGLLIVKEFVTRCKGSINVTSKINEGTVFTIELPKAK